MIWLPSMRKKTKKKIINKLAELLIIMDAADLRSYEMQYLIDTCVDICDLIEKDKAAIELSKMVEEKHVAENSSL